MANLRRSCSIAAEPDATLADLQAVRQIWDWHLRFEKDPAISEMAQECEAAYLRHPMTAPYASIFGSDRHDLEDSVQNGARMVSESIHTVEGWNEFFSGALLFTTTHAEDWRSDYVRSFAWAIGVNKHDDAAVMQFLHRHIGNGRNSELFRVSVCVAKGVLHALRGEQDSSAIATLLSTLFTLPISMESTRDLWLALFVHVSTGEGRRFGPPEIRFFLANADATAKVLSSPEYVGLIGRLVRFEPSLLESVRLRFQETDSSIWHDMVVALWDGYVESLSYPVTADDIVPVIIDKLMTLAAVYGDLGRSDSHLEHRLSQVFKYAPKKSLGWFVSIIRARRVEWRGPPVNVENVRLFPGPDSWVIAALAKISDAVTVDECREPLDELTEIAAEDMVSLHDFAPLAAALDPSGWLVPELVRKRLEALPGSCEIGRIIRWSIFARYYPVKSAAWRTIAIAACRLAVEVSSEDAEGVFNSLVQRRSLTVRQMTGEIDRKWQQAVDEATIAMEEEVELSLRPFWKWRRVLAQEQVAHERGWLEENRLDS